MSDRIAASLAWAVRHFVLVQRIGLTGASQAGIILFSDTPTPVAITPPGEDWRCFHYRTVEMVAPLRNLVSGTAGFNWPQTTLVAP